MLDTEQTMLPQNRVNLEEDEIPTQYYNIQADLREPLPPPPRPEDQATGQPHYPRQEFRQGTHPPRDQLRTLHHHTRRSPAGLSSDGPSHPSGTRHPA